MPWLIYAVLEGQALPDPFAGVEGAPVGMVAAGSLCAAVSRHDRAPPPTPQALLTFGDVVEGLFDRANLIPMRFGSCVADADALRRWLAADQTSLATLLRQFDGCVEMGIRYPWAGEGVGRPVATGGPGHAYLAARAQSPTARAQSAAARRAAERIAAALARPCRGWRLDDPTPGFLGMSFLVPRVDLEDFLHQCRRMAREEDAPLYVSGPWPPYSFATAPPPLPASGQEPSGG